METYLTSSEIILSVGHNSITFTVRYNPTSGDYTVTYSIIKDKYHKLLVSDENIVIKLFDHWIHDYYYPIILREQLNTCKIVFHDLKGDIIYNHNIQLDNYIAYPVPEKQEKNKAIISDKFTEFLSIIRYTRLLE